MQVKNYYALSEPELDQSINTIRMWIFEFQRHEGLPKALFALKVALSAKDLLYSRKTDPFVELVVEHLS